MKLYLTLACILVLCVFVLGCSDNSSQQQPATSAVGKILEGNHLLHQIGDHRETSETLSTGFFLIGGGSSTEIDTKFVVSFSWQGNDGIFRFTTLPLEKVRIVTNSQVNIPFVKFKWNYSDADDLSESIIYALITCNPKDWPEDIQMPDPAK